MGKELNETVINALKDALKNAHEITLGNNVITIAYDKETLKVAWDTPVGWYVLTHLHYADIAVLNSGSSKDIIRWVLRALVSYGAASLE